MDEVYGGTWPGSLVGPWRRVAGFLSGSMAARDWVSKWVHA
jgi:hypothetical protein